MLVPPPEPRQVDMLGNALVTTMLPVIGLERARRFYEGGLGLPALGRSPDVVFEDDDLPGLKTVDHVCVLGAEGNFPCIHENLA